MKNKNSICYDCNTFQEFYFSSDDCICAGKINNLFMQEKDNWICPVLLHTIVPYYLTLMKGGKFTWMRNRDKVIVQCPHPKHPCVVELQGINQSGKFKEVKAKILDIRPECNIKFKKNQVINLEEFFPEQFCLLGFDNAFPYAEYLRNSNLRQISFNCSCPDKNIIILLKKL